MSIKVRAAARQLVLGVAAIALCPTVLLAQTQAPVPAKIAGDTDAPPSGPDIVVTGTLLRNTAAVGTEPITLSPKAIEATGATSTDQVLASIPQLYTFGQLQKVNGGGTQRTVNQVNLRNLPQGVGGSSPTLVLVDGHRIVSEGVKQAYPDPDVVVSDLLERVEVVPDGGSAIYGSDAVGGVVNFITRKDFKGVKASIRQGFADDYHSTDVNLTAGTAWGSGSAYVGYNFSRHSPLYGRDRDYVRNIDYTTGLPLDLTCSPANAVVGGTLYAVTNGNALVAGNQNRCDTSKLAMFYPLERRHSMMASFRQELGSSVEFQVKGFYTNRYNLTNLGPLTPSSVATVTAANPNYISTGGATATSTQQVSYNFGPVNGFHNVTTKLWSYGITPTLTWKIDRNWQVRAYYNYGQSSTTANDPSINAAALSAAVTAGTINPYNIAASNPATVAQVLNYTTYGVGKDVMSNAKLTADGALFHLPGGAVRIAAGGEFLYEQFRGILSNNTNEIARAANYAPASRKVWSGFGEINVPVIGPDMEVPLVRSLTIDASERFDHYSDFGSNWAPNIAATWKVNGWISFRGRWNRSFQAPSLVQLSQAGTPTATVYPSFILSSVALLRNPAVPLNGGPVVAVAGTVSPLQPQKARIYDLGTDINIPFVPGLSLHGTYYNINYRGSIQQIPLGSGPFYDVPGFQNLYIMTPTPAQVQAFLTARGVGAANIANAVASLNGQNAYVVADIRARNLGVALVRGLDFGFDYGHMFGFGSVDASFNSTYTIKSTTAADGVVFLPNQAEINQPRFTSVTRLGTTIDNLRAQLTWNHRASLNLSTPAALNQTTVKGYDTFDLFVKYDVKRFTKLPISLTLSVNNMFDKNPPVYYGNGSVIGAVGGAGYANGNTLGRFFQLGASVSF